MELEPVYIRRYLTLREAKRVSGASLDVFKRAIAKGQLETELYLGREYVPVWALLQWIDRVQRESCAYTNTIAVAVDILMELGAL